MMNSGTAPHRWRRALVVVLAFLTALAGPASMAGAQEVVDEGSVEIIDVTDRTKRVSGGGSGQIFTLDFPLGAACPGDSANEEWRVSGFIIPATDDPGTLRIGPIHPDGDDRWSLVRTTTRPYINESTQQNFGEDNGVGRLNEVPPLTFGVYPPGHFSDGRYTIGLACSQRGVVASYWDTDIIMTTDASDEPGQMTWRLADEETAVAIDDENRSIPAEVYWVGGGLVLCFLLFMSGREKGPKDVEGPTLDLDNSEQLERTS